MARSDPMSPPRKTRVGIVGATGFAGGELLRILSGHPDVELACATSGRRSGPPGQTAAEAHPFLDAMVDLPLIGVEALVAEASALDCVFLALPHGESMVTVPKIPEGVLVVDLSGDYRLRDASAYETHYGRRHNDGAGLDGFVYGLAEYRRTALAGSKRVANPGCFATAVTLALWPLVEGLIGPAVQVSAVTGSSGSGANMKSGLHHARRSESFSAYKVFGHQHLPEIHQLLVEVAPAWGGRVDLQTHSAPMVRGIYATVFAELAPGVSAAAVAAAFHAAYDACPFVRLRTAPPDLKWVRGSNFVDLSWHVEESTRGCRVIVLVALDNLVKGAAGQAVQNMNLALGLSETAGLRAFAGGGL